MNIGGALSAYTLWGGRTNPYNSACPYFRMADLNGHGYSDLVYIDGSNRVHVLMNNLNNTPPSPGFSTDSVACTLPSAPRSSFYLADMDGDGYPDLIYDSNGMFYVLKGDGSGGFGATAEFSAPRAEGYNSAQPNFKIADVNGDGLPDIVYDGADNNLHVLVNTGSSFKADTVWGSYAGGGSWWLADLNGDGLADFVKVTTAGTNVVQSTGNGFDSSAVWSTSSLFSVSADFTGDGLLDLAGEWNSGGTINFNDYVKVALNTGNGFGGANSWLGPVLSGSLFLYSGDFTGDGISDIAVNADYGGSSLIVYPANGPVPDLLTGVTNGLGGSYTINYTPSSAWQNNQHLPFVVQTVSSITANDGNGNASTINYTYSDGYYDTAEREFRGFGYVYKTLPDGTKVKSSFYTANRYNNIDAYKGLMYDQTISDANGVLYQEVINTFAGPGDANFSLVVGTYFPYLIQSETLKYDGGTSALDLVTKYQYDQYGNLLTRDQKGDPNVAGNERFDQINYTTPNLNAWIVSTPADMEVMPAAGGAVLSKTIFAYQPGTNLVASKTFCLNLSSCAANDGVNPTINYSYDAYGNVIQQIDPDGYATTTAYEATRTFPQTATNAKGQSGTVLYDTIFSGQPSQKTDPNGNLTSYTYDVFGRLSKVVDPEDQNSGNATRSYQYPSVQNSNNNNIFGTVGAGMGQNVTVQVMKVRGVTPLYYTKTVYFDGFGRDFSTWSDGPAGTPIAVDTTYDASGRVSQKSLPHFVGGATENVSYAYDCLGRVTRQTNPDGTYTTTSYLQDTITTTDPMGNQKKVQKDAYGRVVQVKELVSPEQVTFYQYDMLGNLVQVTDAKGNKTSITYDSLSRKIGMSDPDMGNWTYGYDKNGNLTSQTDAKGQRIVYQYDPLSRPLEKDYPNGSKISYTYDEPGYANGVGRLTSVSDQSGTSHFSYDDEGRTITAQKTIGQTPYTTQTAYDPLGHINSITYPQNGGVVNYAYDSAFNIVSVTDPASGTVYAAFSGYNALGQPGGINFGINSNGKDSTTTYIYYPLNHRLQEMTTTPPLPAKPVQDMVYGYDDDGNVTAVTDNVVPNNSQQFTYDGLNRLVRATSPSYSTINFTYDSIGNITLNTRVGSYSYSGAGPHAVTLAGTSTYGYDANGNMTSRHTSATNQTLTYDYDNRVSSLTVGAVTTSYVYDFQGARAQKSTNAPASTTTYIGNIYEVTDGVATEHIFAGSRRIASKTGTSTTYYHPDHLGGLNIATGGTGNVTETTFYYPYGETRVNTGSVDLHYKFTGKELDRESGLYYYGARYYDPVIGRFISPDSVVQSPGDPQTLNRYSYCRNNPLLYTDPSGHFFGIDDFIIAMVLGAAFGATTSAIMGGNVGLGALTGAISGAAFALAGGAIQSWGLIQGVEEGNQLAIAEASAIHFAAGAASGAIDAAITHGNIGMCAVTSGVSEGIPMVWEPSSG